MTAHTRATTLTAPHRLPGDPPERYFGRQMDLGAGFPVAAFGDLP